MLGLLIVYPSYLLSSAGYYSGYWCCLSQWVSESQSQHGQWLVLGEGDLSHDEAPAKLSTGTGDSTTSAGAFRSQPSQAAAVTYYTPHLPGPSTTTTTTTTQHTLFNSRFTHRSQLTVSLLIVRRLVELRIIESSIRSWALPSPLCPVACHGVLSGEAGTAWVLYQDYISHHPSPSPPSPPPHPPTSRISQCIPIWGRGGAELYIFLQILSHYCYK